MSAKADSLLDHCAVRVGVGEGLVARSPGCVVFVPDATTAFAPQLLAMIRDGGSRPGRTLVREVARLLLDSDDPAAPAFGLAAAEGSSQLAVMLHGDLTVTITDADGAEEQLSSKGALTWVDRLVEAPFTAVTFGDADPSAGGAAAYDLKDGVVPGGTVTISAAPSSAPEVDLASADQDGADPDSTRVTPVPDAEVAAERPGTVIASRDSADAAPPAPAEAAPAPPPPSPDAVMVAGVCCRNSHFNRPDVTYCSSCGTSMVQQTFKLVDGPRPPLGVLVLEDGTVFTIDQDLVIGREPQNHPAVLAGTATPVVLEDPDLTASRVHAEIVLDGWDVTVIDPGSSNGTIVIPPGETDGQQLERDRPLTILSGTKLKLGDYTLRFDSTYG